MEQLSFNIDTNLEVQKERVSIKDIYEDIQEGLLLNFDLKTVNDEEGIQILKPSKSALEIDLKARINKIVRHVSSNLGLSFSATWNSLYLFANYKMKINIRARKKKSKSLIDSFSEKELIEFEKIVKDWAYVKGFSYEKIAKEI